MRKSSSILLCAAVFFLSTACSKKDDTETGNIPVAAIVQDPSNWNPSVVQSNTNAKQFNYGKVKISKGLSVTLTGLGITEISNHNVHVYLRTAAGTYLHLPANSAGGVSYSFYLKSANPNSSLFVTRGAGAEETYEDIIVLAAKTSYTQSLNPPINFALYSSAKAKLGF